MYLHLATTLIFTVGSTQRFLIRKGSGMHSDTIFGRRGAVLVIPMPGKKVPERYSGLLPPEKKLQERHSGAFRHKNTPGSTYVF
jgi:hypothetical protein